MPEHLPLHSASEFRTPQSSILDLLTPPLLNSPLRHSCPQSPVPNSSKNPARLEESTLLRALYVRESEKRGARDKRMLNPTETTRTREPPEIPSAPDVPDKTLLDRFVASRDENAFAALLQRHGPMVLGVCRRLLGKAHDAEDAFQAAFLVLARQAGRISRKESVGSWLYGVAYRVSLRARRTMSHRQRHEARHAAEQVAFDPGPAAADGELSLIVDEELHRLPERFREPLVLCYLAGKTNEEAARELGCPEGTLFSRLARGRERLRRQLARRGVVLGTGLIAAALAAQAAPAAVPAPLAATTLAAAAAFAGGSAAAMGTIAASVVGLAQATLRNLFLLQLKNLAATLFLSGALAGGAALIAYSIYDATFSARSIAAAADARQLQGTWIVVALEQDGREQSVDQFASANDKMIFEGNRLSKRSLVPGGEAREDVAYTLDPTQSPRAIDLKKSGQRLLGIYEL